jgi:hypothetical protein
MRKLLSSSAATVSRHISAQIKLLEDRLAYFCFALDELAGACTART